jgi:hypothetical protein
MSAGEAVGAVIVAISIDGQVRAQHPSRLIDGQ